MTNKPAGESSRPGKVSEGNLSGIVKAIAHAVYRDSPNKLDAFEYRIDEVLSYGPLKSIRFGIGYISVKTQRLQTTWELALNPSVVEDFNIDATPETRIAMAKKHYITYEQKLAVVQEIAKHFGIMDMEFMCTEFRTDSDEATEREPAALAESLFRSLDAGFGHEHYRTLTFNKPGAMRMDVKGNTYGHEYYLDIV